MRNLDQERSVHARKRALAWKVLPEKERKEILSECRRLPAVLQVNGLIAFLLFAESSRRSAETGATMARGVTVLHEALSDWLSGPESPVELSVGVSLPVALTEDRRVYRQAFAEAIAYATWLKRWADATLAPVAAAGL